jgi:hypothetical protein
LQKSNCYGGLFAIGFEVFLFFLLKGNKNTSLLDRLVLAVIIVFLQEPLKILEYV